MKNTRDLLLLKIEGCGGGLRVFSPKILNSFLVSLLWREGWVSKMYLKRRGINSCDFQMGSLNRIRFIGFFQVILLRRNLYKLFILGVTLLFSACGDKSNPWPAIAKADLDYIKVMVEQNHPGYFDPNNPQFKSRLEQNYKNAIDQLKYVQSIDAVMNLDNEFIASFADYHVSINFRFYPAFPLWAGIKIERNNEKYVVRKLADAWPTKQPTLGSELVSCDGRTAKEIMDYDILRYRYANYEAEYPREKYASKFFIDDGVGYRKRAEKCMFRDADNTETTVELKWKAFEKSGITEWDSALAQPDVFSTEKIGDSVVWLRVPSFQPELENTDKVIAILKSVENIGAGKTVVFDVRGNGGGYLGSATTYLKHVYGAPAFFALFATEIKQDTTLLRASPAHLQRLSHILDGGNATNAEREKNLALISVLDESIKKNAPYAKSPDHRVDFTIADKRSIEDIRKSLPRIVVLTDHFCASECLTFVQMVLHEPNNLHVGEMTYADSAYSMIYPKFPFELPSKLGTINLPFSIFGQKGPFTPTIKFDGDMNDTATLKQWVLNLIR